VNFSGCVSLLNAGWQIGLKYVLVVKFSFYLLHIPLVAQVPATHFHMGRCGTCPSVCTTRQFKDPSRKAGFKSRPSSPVARHVDHLRRPLFLVTLAPTPSG